MSGLIRITFILLMPAMLGLTLTAQVPPPDESSSSQNWFSRQFEHFRSYPHLSRAYQHQQEGRLEEARQEYETYLSMRPDDAEARLAYVILLHRMGQYGEVIQHGEPGFFPPEMKHRALLYRGLARWQGGGNGEGALSDLRNALSNGLSNEETALASETAAAVAVDQGQYQFALETLERIPGKDNSCSLLLVEAAALQRVGRSAEARRTVQLAQSAAQPCPEPAGPYRAQAALLMELEDWAAALTAAEAGLRRFPRDPVLLRVRTQSTYHLNDPAAEDSAKRLAEVTGSAADHLMLAEILYSRRKLSDAVNEAEAALSGAEDSLTRGRAHRILGEIATRRGRFPEAQRHFEQAAEALPAERDELYFAAANAASRQNNIDAAVQLVRKIENKRPGIHEFQANLEVEQGKFEDAIKRYRYVLLFLKAPENRSRLLLSIGNAYSRWNKPREAAQAYHEVDALGVTGVSLQLARSLETAGQTEEAIAAYEQYLENRPDAGVRLELANLMEQQGSLDEAVALIDLALDGLEGEARAPALRQRAFLNLKQGDKQAARDDLRAAYALTDGPNNVLSLAQIELDLDEPAAALELLEKVARSRSDQMTLRLLLTAYSDLDRNKEALAIAEQLLERASPATPEAAEAHLAVAEHQLRLGLYRKAAQGMLTAYEWSEDRSLYPLEAAVEALIRVEDWETAEQVNRRLIDEAGSADSEVMIAAYRRQAELARRLGHDEDVVRNLQLALDSGGEGADLHLALGLALLERKHHDEAIDHFHTALRLEPSNTALLGIARGYERQGRTGLAIHYFEKVLSRWPDHPAPGELSRELLTGLGYLYFENHDYQAAGRVWEQSLDLHEDKSVRVRLARVYRLTNRLDKHRQTLVGLDGDLQGIDRVLYLEETAHRHYHGGRIREAVDRLAECDCYDPSDARSFLIGSWLLEDGRCKDALPYLRQAVDSQPDNAVFVARLAYAYQQQGRIDEAIPLFEQVLKIDPDYLDIHRDLGYAYARTADNEKAVASFERAIDQVRLYRDWSAAERKQVDDDVFRLRREVAKLKNRLDLTFYFAQSADDRPLDPVLAPLGVTTLPSQGGAELAFQPPGIGFRNERTFQVFARILWGFKERTTFDIDPDTYQAGFGARYKPLRSQNLQLSVERLFGIGDRAVDNWLLRGTHSWNSRDAMRVHQHWGNYTFFLNDLAYFVNAPRALTYYGEVRQGVTYNIRNRFGISPHVTLLGRAYPSGRIDDPYIETGVGISWQLRLRDSQYEAPRSSLELLLQYRWGHRFLREEVVGPSHYDNLVFGLISVF